jgi:hypothetical protein
MVNLKQAESVVVLIEILSHHLPRGTNSVHERTESWWLVSWPKFRHRTSQIRVQNFTATQGKSVLWFPGLSFVIRSNRSLGKGRYVSCTPPFASPWYKLKFKAILLTYYNDERKKRSKGKLTSDLRLSRCPVQISTATLTGVSLRMFTTSRINSVIVL